MPRIWAVLILILLSSLPVIAVYVWFRLAKYSFSLHRFLFVLLAGATALFPAFFLQAFLNFTFHDGRAAMFYHHFIRIALSEELSRLLVLSVFFWISARIKQNDSAQLPASPLTLNIVKKATATGLVAGLGFALLENAIYAASDVTVLPLRIIITAAVHAACGARVGAAAVMLRTRPVQAIMRVLTAAAIHGVYNLMITMPGFSPITAILIAVSALFSTILTIRGGWSSENEEVFESGNIITLLLNKPASQESIFNEPPMRELDKDKENP